MEDADLEPVVALLSSVLGARPAGVDRRELFEWKHLGNPFGRSIAFVAEKMGRVVGLRAFMRWRFITPSGEVHAARAVDTATDPDLQRQGVFTRLTREGLDECEHEGVSFVFNTPNEKSLPGYIKLGWVRAGRVPVWIRSRRPARLLFAAAARRLAPGGTADAPEGFALMPAQEFLARAETESLVESLAEPPGPLVTPRSTLYLRWRYGEGPVPYFALAVGDPPSAFAIVRLRSRGDFREAVVCEALSSTAGEVALRGLLRSIPRESGSDHAIAHFGQSWPAAAVLTGAGYRRLPRLGPTLVVRQISSGPTEFESAKAWGLSLGDVELF
jgi:GNAT superfamily N-acetyltransferase